MSDWQVLAETLGPQSAPYRSLQFEDGEPAVRAVKCARCGAIYEVLADEPRPDQGWECESCMFTRAIKEERP